MKLVIAGNQYLAFCEFTKKLSAHSIKAYKRDIEQFVIFSGGQLNILEINKEHIRKFVDFCFLEELSHATIKRRLACLKSFFKWLENDETIPLTPFAKLDLKIRVPQKLPRNLSVQELSALLKASKKKLGILNISAYLYKDFLNITPKNINDLTTLVCIELLYSTGVRVGELAEIRLTDIYFSEEYIHIRGKGQRERRVFLVDNSVKRLVKIYIKCRNMLSPDHNFLLINRLGRAATCQSIRIWLKQCSKNAKLSRIATPHMCRHSTATELLANGVDIIYVQKLLGHQSITTTQLYTHISYKDTQRNIARANLREDIL